MKNRVFAIGKLFPFVFCCLGFMTVEAQDIAVVTNKKNNISSSFTSIERRQKNAFKKNIFAIDATVTGKVTDQSGKAMPGVTIAVKGTTISALTDADGLFVLTLPTGDETLVISYIGYILQEVKVQNRTTIAVSMTLDTKSLEDVVVVGYGTRKRTEVTGAVASISGEKLRSVSTANLTTALQGRVAGVEVAPNSFRPGAGARIRIRGNRSLTGSNEPLYVVDGIPVNYNIDDMNPTDIESIDILKDAASTAIYGVRGASGVVQITTKKGKLGKVSVNYEGSASVDNILRKREVFNAVQLADVWRQAYYADKQYNYAQSATTQPNNYFPSAAADVRLFGGNTGNAMWEFIKDAYQFTTFDRATNTYVAVKRPTTTEEKALLTNLGLPVLTEIDVYDPSKVKGYDWGNNYIRRGNTNSHNINISVGTEKLRSSFGLSYFKQKGIEYGDDYTRYTISNNSEFKIAKFVTFGNSLSYSNALQNTGPSMYGSALGMLPFTKPFDSTGKFLLYPNGDQQIVSGANDLNRILNENKTNRLFGNVFLEFTLFKGLKYKTVFGLDYRNVRNGRFNGTNTSIRQTGLANASYTVTNNMSWTYDNMLLYDTKIADNHSINITLLQELQTPDRTDFISMTGNDLIFEEQKWYSLNRNSLGLVTGSGNYSTYTNLSYMARVEYGYKNRYLLTLSNRHDASSVFVKNKGQYFPSASVAWRLDNENFFDKQHIFSAAKIRFGIGKVGSSAIGPYQTNGPLAFTNYNWGNGNPAIGLAPSTYRVPDLTWEGTLTKDLGIEFSLLKNRITGTVDIYKSSTTNVLQRQTIPSANGFDNLFVNLGELTNKGIDVALSTVNINNKNGFRWVTDFVFSKNKEAIASIDATGGNNLANLWFKGQPLRVYYNYVSEGIFQFADTAKGGILADYFWTVPANKASGLFAPGKVRVKDLNGDKIIDGNDKKVLGTENANWTGSITNTVSYKNIELNVNVYFRKGGMYRVPRPALVGRFQSNYVNYWTPTNPSNEYQQPTRTSDVPTYWEALGYRDGSFTRIRNISLAYKFPQAIVSRFKANSMTFYINAINPFLFHKASNFDPETIQYTEQFASVTGNPRPNSDSYRSIILGIKLGL